MANEIGQAIPEEPQKAANPQFEQAKQWLSKPENLMTMLVLAGSMVQDRRPGQSKVDAFAERGLGTLGFRGELQRLNRQDVIGEDERRLEEAFKRGQLDAQAAQTQAYRENTAADERVGMGQIEMQGQTARLGRETQLEIERMRGNTDRAIAEMQLQLRQAQDNTLLTTDDMKAINEMYSNSLNGDTPYPSWGAAFQDYMRAKALVDPRIMGQLQFFAQPEVATPSVPAPGPVIKEKAPAKKPGYTKAPPIIPATGLPNPMLGQSIGPGPHEAPPAKKNYPLYPGTK